MGNRTGVALFFMMFALVFSSVDVWGAGGDCESAKIPLSKLDYVGINFGEKLSSENGVCTVINGVKNDRDAMSRCSGGYIINPGNPQYINTQDHGDLSSNNLGYYFCITRADFNKKRMCDEAGGKHRELNIRFVIKGNDGTCVCGPNGSTQKVDCAQADLTKIAAAPSNDLKRKCEQSLGGVYVDENGAGCFCKDDNGNTYETLDIHGSKTCKDFSNKTAAATTPEVPDAEGRTPALKKCVDDKVKEAELCETTGEEAKSSCDTSDKKNQYVAEALKVPDVISEVFIKANMGKGKSGECFKAGVVSRSIKYAVQDMPEECKDKISKCTAACNIKEKLKEYDNQCGALGKVKDKNSKDKEYFSDKRQEIEDEIKGKASVCSVEAKKNYDTLEYYLSGLANSFKAGMLCACAIGQSGTACNSIPTEAQCLANPALAGCYVYDAADICSPRSSKFNQQGCACQSNPQGPGCPAFVQANPNNSGFAGPDIKLPSGGGAATSPTAGFGGASSGGAGGGFGADGLDLNPQKPDELANVGKPNVGGPGFLGGAGGGGGGGGGSGGGGGGGSAEQPNRDADGGPAASSGGVFGQAKSFMGSLFGGNKNNANNAGRGAMGNLKVNTDQFKPKGMRGLAGNDGVGSKNMDIWQMMNNRYDENQNTFILTP